MGNSEKMKQKQNIIKFHRYVRPLNPDTAGIDSKKGLTFEFVLDYNCRIINFQFSICDGDNFEKKYGRMMVDRRVASYGYYQLPMPEDGIHEDGCVEMVMNIVRITNDSTSPIVPRHLFKKLLAQWERRIYE